MRAPVKTANSNVGHRASGVRVDEDKPRFAGRRV